MTLELLGKTALVTGSSRGIGRQIAFKLADLGANLSINYKNDKTSAERVCEHIRSIGREAIALQADVSKPEQIRELFAQTMAHYGAIDILVNNAGLLITKPIAQVTEDEFNTLFSHNVTSVFFACQQAAHKLADNGRIINISTTVTKIMMPGYGLYAATKGAVDQITRVLSKELGARGITVNSVSPGPTDTELFRDGKTSEQIAAMAAMSACNRIGTPEDIADAVALLVREDARWITGQNIYVNGGLAG
ncbi:SDR family oxidoreductase [Desulfogranum japonicum]|uniref:SDR family oxidoreductase n=1 Tax=Desulfogranum japonicum TaxID=231447 RepID=UPI00040F3B6C|nr:SDR family oxidoreductase [Desulfogranum japonicum]